jgi:ketosteroid isomerase-like protein
MHPQNKTLTIAALRGRAALPCRLICILLGALAFTAPQTSNAMNTDNPSGDETAIRALEQNFSDAVNARNVDKIMASYEHGPKLVFFDVVPRQDYLGWDAYKKDWQHFLSAFNGPIAFEIQGLDITAVGDFAYSHSFQHVTGQTAAGKHADYTVRVTDVYRKTNGQWLIVQEHVSVPVDLKTGKADFGSKP